jgi:hypothetical protein
MVVLNNNKNSNNFNTHTQQSRNGLEHFFISKRNKYTSQRHNYHN